MSPREVSLPTQLTVLVVDDDPTIVELMTKFFTQQGLMALSAYDGQQCLEIVGRGTAIDAIVLDFMMPGMNGLAVCAALRKMAVAQSVPIIFLTAYDDPDARLAGAALGANAFLVKPVRGRDLLACIQTHIAANHQKSEEETCP
jgi:DNA-binding response OmpR family regulator